MAINIIQGNLVIKNKKIAIIVSRFNDFITDKLLSGALDGLSRNGLADQNITIVKVPGAFEIPYTTNKLAKSGGYDGIICLGTLIRGDTPHFDYIANENAKGIAQVAMDTGLPVIYSVITCETIQQAIERAGTKSGNKGYDAALAMIEMIDLFNKL